MTQNWNRVTFEVDIEDVPGGVLKIKVVESPDGRFSGVPNFLVVTVPGTDPYGSSELEDTLEAAFEDTFREATRYRDNVSWVSNEGFCDPG